MVTLKDYEGGETAWCPGCGNFQILQAVKQAFVNLDLEPHQVLFVSGIGQASKLPLPQVQPLQRPSWKIAACSDRSKNCKP